MESGEIGKRAAGRGGLKVELGRVTGKAPITTLVSNISQLNQEGSHLVSSGPGLACLERIGKVSVYVLTEVMPWGA